MKGRYFSGASAVAVAVGLMAAGAAQAQGSGPATVEEVVVTGSFIRGTPEDAALPVDVLTADELQKSGAPTIKDLIKTLGVSSGTDGETNQFSSNGLEGLSNVNLRGLGPARTLVLLNGRRMVSAPYGIAESAQTFVDTNLIPAAAIGRIEILKDGAAALYGSDAIAGVVNFITNRRLSGLVASADYSTFDGSDGEWNASLAYGWQGDNTSWVTTVGYNFRSETSFDDVDVAKVSFAENPQSGYSGIGNPGRILNALAVGTSAPGTLNVIDPGCTNVGGTIANGACQFRFIPFDNLVEEETRYQIFSELNHRFDNGVEAHVEVLYANTDVPKWKTSPSYPPQRPVIVVPTSHPGFQALLSQFPSLATANPWLATAPAVLWTGRSFGWGGFPGNGGGAQVGSRSYEAYRISAGLKGEFENGWGWDLAFTHMEDVGKRSTNDTFVDRFNRALGGLGGPNCTGTTPGANGCLFYNPFSTAIKQGAFSSAPNPNFVASVENSPALANWLVGASATEATTKVTVFDAVVDGETGFQLGGGNVAFAAGMQYRTDAYALDPNDNADFTKNPCAVPGQTNCTSKTGVFGFLAPTTPADVDRNVWAVFTELNLPFSEQFEGQLAIRHEDYGGSIGATTNPKLSLRYEVTEDLVLRGSAGTTFRGPSLNQLSGQFTSLAFVAQAGAFKAIDTFGNSALDPETATTFNVGAVFNRGDFKGSIDFWSFDFKDPIIVEPFGPLLANVLANPTGSPFANRVTFSANPPTAATFERIRVNIANGPDVNTSGIDASAEYSIPDVLGGAAVTFGGDMSYVLEYKVDALVIDGVQIAAPFDAVGRFNRTAGYIRPMPQWKANVFIDYARDQHNLRWVARYITDYKDERGDLPSAAAGNIFLAAPVLDRGRTIDSSLQQDLHYRWKGDNDLTITASVIDLFDEGAPFARFETNFDPYTGRAFGRTFKVGVSKKFGGF
ncbi:TonB-dependent receptor [Phenylobacterium sp.]|uniref:TonB-dependent receptor plug domain-containing protein n=2 Tax=Phenylobacterium sp. TaxID=1871053 RepID=UPI0025FED4CE|nr:TonB-dependent receptor [Phenylobacterium sp.]MCA3747441.1 TonB-dependent receptor [Phenylobacterium sp.]